jgi:serine protease Do
MATLILENDSTETICYVLISPADTDEWGDDWLGESDVIEPGDTHTFESPAGIYDLEARDCDGKALATEWDQDLDETVTWTISDVASADGDDLDVSLEPNFGLVDLEPGFLPDPQTIDLISGGEIDVEALGLGSDCGGYATSAPDLRLNLTDGSDVLRIFFVADESEDATLIINDPYGNWYCNDDFSGWDPMIVLENAESGQYDLWVGSYSADEYIIGTLYITEMDYDPGNLPEETSMDSGSLDISLDPAFGSVELSSGFQPDPYEVALISGGSVDVYALGLGSDCGGYVASAPDYRINLADGFDLLRIFFVADEEDDATLIVNDPYGNWYCNDDFSGWDPLIGLKNAEDGQYDIWVGSYSADEFIVGTLYITEMDYDPDNLP